MPVMETSTLGILIAAGLGAVVLFFGRKLFWLFVVGIWPILYMRVYL